MPDRTRPDWLADAHRGSDWSQVHVLVNGLGVSGFAAADALQHLGAHVVVLDAGRTERAREQATLLEALGCDVRLGPDTGSTLPGDADDLDLVVTTPGWPPTTPLLVQAAERSIPVWGDVELAWRLREPRPDGTYVPWLCLTGTNGKTTTVQMLEAMLRADGKRAVAAGNVGLPICEVVMDPEPYDVIAVELSSFQLHWSHSLSPLASCVLNVAPDHLSWHGSMEAYAADKASIYERTQVACVYNVEDDQTRRMVEEADVVEGCRAIGFTLGVPGVAMIGVVDDVIADRAFIESRQRNAAEIALVSDVPTQAPHNVADALAAACLARAYGVEGRAVQRGLRAFHLDAHRISTVAEVDGVAYVDDSKATNTHAAQASLAAYDSVVWIAGGDAKGATVDELVAAAASRLRAAVLLGKDRRLFADALARHAPEVPVIVVPDADDGAMARVVRAAADQARPGDVVLLAPASASTDMYPSYHVRGDAFAAAVAELSDRRR